MIHIGSFHLHYFIETPRLTSSVQVYLVLKFQTIVFPIDHDRAVTVYRSTSKAFDNSFKTYF